MNGQSRMADVAFETLLTATRRHARLNAIRGCCRLSLTRSAPLATRRLDFFSSTNLLAASRRLHSTIRSDQEANAEASINTSFVSLEEIRRRLIQKSLEQVPVHGWTRNAVVEAASRLVKDLGGKCSMSISGLISEPEALIFEQMRLWKEQLEHDLNAIDASDELSVGERARLAIQARLGYMRPLLESGMWSTAMAIGANPLYATETAFHLNELSAVVGNFCFQGIRNDDSFAFQAQQASLGAIYVATELHLLTDDFPYDDTWEFLRQRISEWEALWAFQSHSTNESSPNPTIPSSLSPTDALSVAWTVSSALVSGLQSVVNPHGAFVGDTTRSSLLKELKPPKQLPALPVLGAPPAPLATLWSAMFDDDSRKFAPAATADGWGTSPSHYGPPTKSTH